MKKIMFNDRFGLTTAVLQGRKMQTRRVIPQSWIAGAESFREDYFNDTLDCLDGKELLEQYFLVDEKRKPHYAPGEILAVAQSYNDIGDYYYSLGKFNERKVSEQELIYHNAMRIIESTGDDAAMRGDDNKMFVRAELMPFRIRITGVRIERLQDISDEDCLKEGIRPWNESEETSPRVRQSLAEIKAAGVTPYQIPGHWDCYSSPREAFASLIDKVSGNGTWEKNPWVFVYDFEFLR